LLNTLFHRNQFSYFYKCCFTTPSIKDFKQSFQWWGHLGGGVGVISTNIVLKKSSVKTNRRGGRRGEERITSSKEAMTYFTFLSLQS
jgi:hypothetical protein